MDSPLFGPDDSDAPGEAIEEVGDRITVWARQHVNRWVLPQASPAGRAQ